MMKNEIIIFFSALSFHGGSAQSKMIKEVFMHLPADKVYEFTRPTRDSMLQGKTYYPVSNDSSSIEAFNYGKSELVKDYMYVSSSYESGQRGSGMVELRIFKTKKGDDLVLVSQTAGVWPIIYRQVEVSAFIYNRDKKMVPYKKKIFPAVNEEIFMKQGIPDSIKKLISNNSNCIFNLNSEKITFGLSSLYLSEQAIVRKWLKGDRVEFNWTGDQFVVNRIFFD
jgi:hypothetical protein